MTIQARLRGLERRFDALGIGDVIIDDRTLRNVQIFRSGHWNGRKFTSRDLDDILAAFDPSDWRPPVKLGHDDDPKAPAYGWVATLDRVGDVLVADLEGVDPGLIEQIRAGRYDTVSVELFANLKRGGRRLPLALKAVAILGAHPPAVGGLKPLREALV